MNAEQIDVMVQYYRDEEMKKIHANVNSTPDWKKDEQMAKDLAALDVRVARYRRSLGAPDVVEAQEPADELTDEPATKVVPRNQVQSDRIGEHHDHEQQ